MANINVYIEESECPIIKIRLSIKGDSKKNIIKMEESRFNIIENVRDKFQQIQEELKFLLP